MTFISLPRIASFLRSVSRPRLWITSPTLARRGAGHLLLCVDQRRCSGNLIRAMPDKSL